MSNIPNSAMPHAGGQKEMSGNDTGSVQPARDFDGNRGSQRGNYAGTGSTGSSGTYQPDTYRRETYYADRSRENSGGLMEKAREHKTGIAVGMAVGAIAAAAIPFMLGRKKSNERDFSAQYDRDFYVDKRSSARNGSSGAMSGTTTTGTSGTTGASGSTTTTGTGGSTLGSGSSSGSSGSSF